MLERDHPPDNWNDLLQEAKGEADCLDKASKAEI
jgi:hypothetical protein